MLFGFPGERNEDRVRAYDLAMLVTHLQPPTSVGMIRLDRFSPNFTRAEELGIVNVRPASYFRFVYPFDTVTLMDLVYFFEFDYADGAPAGGELLGRMIDHVQRWSARNDVLTATFGADGLAIRDTRPVASRPRWFLRSWEAALYELCDRRRRPGELLEILSAEHDDVSSTGVKEALERLVEGKIMVEEKRRTGCTLASRCSGTPAMQTRRESKRRRAENGTESERKR